MILIVDDEPFIAETIARILLAEKIIAVQTTRSEEVLELLKNGNFTCVITDVAMPFLNGIELAKEIKAIKPKIKIVCVSAYSEILKDEILAAGADFIVPKPFSPKQIVSSVKKAA